MFAEQSQFGNKIISNSLQYVYINPHLMLPISLIFVEIALKWKHLKKSKMNLNKDGMEPGILGPFKGFVSAMPISDIP